MNKITILIVDDERLARRAVRGLLENDPEVIVVGEAGDGEKALELITEKQPQLVFLDVQMPIMTGLEVLQQLPPAQRPEIIFVTAFDEFALKAFELHAVDYLVKPFSDRRFVEALARAKGRLQRGGLNGSEHLLRELLQYIQRTPTTPPAGDAAAKRLVVKADGQLHFIEPRDIRWIEGQGDFVKLHLVKGGLMTRMTMTRIMEQLERWQFQRIHKSTIVNLSFVRRIKPMLLRSHGVELDDGTMLPVGRNYRAAFEKYL